MLVLAGSSKTCDAGIIDEENIQRKQNRNNCITTK
jgi:hypothetical protein